MAAKDDDWENLKEVDSFICPITCCVMEDPVTTMDGHTYERTEIASWLEANDVSPVTGAPLVDKTLIPNHNLKKAIAEYAADPTRSKWLLEMSVRHNVSEPAFPTSRVELLIVGPAGVGKSSLLRRLRDGGFLADMDSTVGFDYEHKSFATGAKNCHAKVLRLQLTRRLILWEFGVRKRDAWLRARLSGCVVLTLNCSAARPPFRGASRSGTRRGRPSSATRCARSTGRQT